MHLCIASGHCPLVALVMDADAAPRLAVAPARCGSEEASKGPLLKVRTITTGLTLLKGQGICEWARAIEEAAEFNKAAASAFVDGGFEVQTTRISTNSFEEYVDTTDVEAAMASFAEIDGVLERCGVGLFNAGPATSDAGRSMVSAIVQLGPRISASGTVSGPFDRAGCRSLARVVKRIAAETEGGEGNFQFCGAFNVQPGIPFFPAAYHGGGGSTFALGCETSALLWDAMPRAGGDMALAEHLITEAFEVEMAPLEAIAKTLAEAHSRPYAGIDASVAPLATAPHARRGRGRAIQVHFTL